MRTKFDGYIHVVTLFVISSLFMPVYSCQHATEPYAPASHVHLQNQTEHSGVRLTIIEADTAVFSESDGSYKLPPLTDGQWTLNADYPYYDEAKVSFTVRNGKPTSNPPGIFLHQEVKFEVTTDKRFYEKGEDVTIKCTAVNLTSRQVALASRYSPQEGRIIGRNNVIIDGGFRGISPAGGYQPFSAKERKMFSVSWHISDSLDPGTYQIFAFYTDDYDHIMNQTLFTKWIPAIIIIE